MRDTWQSMHLRIGIITGAAGTERRQPCFSSDWASKGERGMIVLLGQKPTSCASFFCSRLKYKFFSSLMDLQI